MKKVLKRIFWTVTVLLGVFIALTVIEMFTGGNALYKWDVRVSANVRDDLTGTDVVEYRLSYSIFDSNNYREVSFRNGNYIVKMEYCWGEGLISSLFNDKATPKPSFYTFKVSAQGYEDKWIDGKSCTLKYLSQNNGYELLLTEVKLHKLNS